jgi:hypothetical protein
MGNRISVLKTLFKCEKVYYGLEINSILISKIALIEISG